MVSNEVVLGCFLKGVNNAINPSLQAINDSLFYRGVKIAVKKGNMFLVSLFTYDTDESIISDILIDSIYDNNLDFKWVI